MIEKRDNENNKHKKVFVDDYYKKKELRRVSELEIMEKRLVSRFFSFFAVVIGLILILCLFFRTIGFFPLIFAIFFIYSRISKNKRGWKENYLLIKSNKWGGLFYNFMYFFTICFFGIIFYVSLNHNYGFKIRFMDILLKYLISFENWLKLI